MLKRTQGSTFSSPPGSSSYIYTIPSSINFRYTIWLSMSYGEGWHSGFRHHYVCESSAPQSNYDDCTHSCFYAVEGVSGSQRHTTRTCVPEDGTRIELSSETLRQDEDPGADSKLYRIRSQAAKVDVQDTVADGGIFTRTEDSTTQALKETSTGKDSDKQSTKRDPK